MKRYAELIEDRLTGRHKKCIRFAGDVRNKKILDIGCYNGWFERFALAGNCAEITGIDTSEYNLSDAAKQVKGERVKFLKAAAMDLSQFETSYFDVVTMFDVLEHVARGTEKKCLMEARRILKKEGMLVVSVPNNSFASRLLDPAWYFGHRHYSKDEMSVTLSRTGYEVESVDFGGGFYELFSMILLYIFKWIFRREMPFKKWVDEKRDLEYLDGKSFVTLFVKARSAQ